jgi:hypothetical protein
MQTDYSSAKRVTVAFKVSAFTARELREAAERDERTVSCFLRKLLERALR